MPELTQEATHDRVKVANAVIAQIAAMTALQVEGVAGVADRSNQIARVIRGGGLQRAVKVEQGDDDRLRLQLLVVAENGRNLPALAAEVQSKVAAAVDRMLGLSTSTVDVYFADVRFSEPGG